MSKGVAPGMIIIAVRKLIENIIKSLDDFKGKFENKIQSSASDAKTFKENFAKIWKEISVSEFKFDEQNKKEILDGIKSFIKNNESLKKLSRAQLRDVCSRLNTVIANVAKDDKIPQQNKALLRDIASRINTMIASKSK